MALLASPSNGLPPLDPVPALRHASRVADEACHIAGDHTVGVSTSTRPTPGR